MNPPVFTEENLASVPLGEIAALLNACYRHDLDNEASLEDRVFDRMQKLFGNMQAGPRYRCDCGNAMTQYATSCQSCWKKICIDRTLATVAKRKAGARKRNFVSDEELILLRAGGARNAGAAGEVSATASGA